MHTTGCWMSRIAFPLMHTVCTSAAHFKLQPEKLPFCRKPVLDRGAGARYLPFRHWRHGWDVVGR